MLIAHGSQFLEEPRIGRSHATFALDRLDDDTAGAGSDLVAQAFMLPNGTCSKPSTTGPNPCR